MAATIVAISLLGLLALGVPIAFSLGLVGSGMIFFIFGSQGLLQIAQVAFKTLDNFVLTAIPMFILMAELMLKGGMGKNLFNVATKWLQWLPGGLAASAVGASAIFAAISGSSAATAATVGLVSYGEMKSRGYPRGLIVGSIVGGGTLGILIPPSIPMLLYGSLTGQSVGKLFIAGIIPGLIITAAMIIYIATRCYLKGDVPAASATPWRERWQVLKEAMLGLLTIPLVLGGIYAGWFTPTEAAGVGVVYILLVSVLIYHSLSWKAFLEACLNAAQTSAMILLIVIGAMILGHATTLMQWPQLISQQIMSLEINRWLVVVIFNLFFLLLGMFLDSASIMLITVPIVYPIITALGFDPIWFAVILVINMEIGYLTPPVGMNLFIVQGLDAENSFTDVARGALPFIVLEGALLAFFIAFPNVSLWLPSLMKK